VGADPRRAASGGTLFASTGGTIRETSELAKVFAEAPRQHGDSKLINALVTKRPHVPRYQSREEAE
jgi:hypothetical protein